MSHHPYIELNVKWDGPESVEDKAALAWGYGTLSLGGEHVWFHDGGYGSPGDILWTWIDLLEFLSRSWSRILYEENHSLSYMASHPDDAAKRSAEEDDELFRFVLHHDLAEGMRGIQLPSIMLLREGNQLCIRTRGRDARRPLRDAMSDLEAIGNAINARISQSDNARSQMATSRWESRGKIADIDFIAMRSGIKSNALRGVMRSFEYWEVANDDDSETLAAARFTRARLDESRRKSLIEQMRLIPHSSTPVLDGLSRDAESCVVSFKQNSPLEQGLRVAQWLRSQPGVTDDHGCVEPGELLRQWNVPVVDMSGGGYRGIEAVGCWGPKHGPAILLNPLREKSKRSTLAHEVCHLLLDRTTSMPMAEVLGGASPYLPERRANAFAAEFLIPQEIVASHAGNYGNLIDMEFFRYIAWRYNVSHQIAAQQLWNSSFRPSLKPQEVRLLKSLAPPIRLSAKATT